MNAIAYLLRGCLCCLAVPAIAGYFPINSQAVFEYEGESRYGTRPQGSPGNTITEIRRTFSSVVSGSGDSYQRITDSILEIDSIHYPPETDTLFKIKTYKIIYSDTGIGFDSLFADFKFSVGFPRLGKNIFSSPLPKTNFGTADGLIANACRFPLKGVLENCVQIGRGYDTRNQAMTDTSTIVFSENFGVKEASYSFLNWGGSSYNRLSLRRVLSPADTIDFSNSEVVGLINREKRARYQGLDEIRKNRPVTVDIYSLQGKLLYSRKFGPGEAIDVKGKPDNALLILHFGTGHP